MLGRLIAYDFKALGRSLLLVQLLVLLVALGTTAALTLYLRSMAGAVNGASAERMMQIAGVLIVLVTMLFIAALLASSFVTLFLVARHFYKNLLGDEGYLSFTLPVTVAQHIAAKTISGLIWVLFNGVVVTLSIGVLVYFGTAQAGLINSEVLHITDEMFRQFVANNGLLLFAELPVYAFVGAINQLLLVYFAIAAGAALANKHKVAIAVLIYLGAGFVANIVSSVAQAIAGAVAVNSADFIAFAYTGDFHGLIAYYQVTFLAITIVSALLIVVYYALTHYLLSNRLNLE
ncbi:MAG: hypothetical protein LBS58_01095 [Coriobacteriales bacterium]|nr:hypothetical protein [Coriobacteriales bacterium]